MRLMTFFAAGCLSNVDLTMAVAQDAMVHCLPIVLASSRSFKVLSDSARGAFELWRRGWNRTHGTVTRTTVFETALSQRAIVFGIGGFECKI